MDRATTIKFTGAFPQDPEQGYGGVARWFVPEELRGNPDEFRCPDCQLVGCHGMCTDQTMSLEKRDE